MDANPLDTALRWRNSTTSSNSDEESIAGYKKVDKVRFEQHTDHVMKVEYVADLNCMISASLDSTVKVFDLERQKLKRMFSEHKKGVYSFQWCSQTKIMASCGVERFIHLWSPYSKVRHA